MEVFGFRKLEVYMNAKELVKKTYALMKKFPSEEKYALCDQLRRAAFSVPSNIAEGVSRYSVKEKIHFLEIAYGSLMEVASQMEIACDLGYVTTEERQNYDQLVASCARQISGLKRSFEDS